MCELCDVMKNDDDDDGAGDGDGAGDDDAHTVHTAPVQCVLQGLESACFPFLPFCWCW